MKFINITCSFLILVVEGERHNYEGMDFIGWDTENSGFLSLGEVCVSRKEYEGKMTVYEII
jgi:hypothetical protein